MNVKANFCAYIVWIKFCYLLFQCLLQQRETEASFVYIIFAVLLVKIVIVGFWNGGLLPF